MQDLRRSNFTAADCRDCNFKNTKLQGTYFIKTVVARANFEVQPLSFGQHQNQCGLHSGVLMPLNLMFTQQKTCSEASLTCCA